ncbi:MAG: protein translocase subunit SecD [Dehalococcoidia bacterium]|nr:protein translocase subunit SecD [Dehalococcoidia bacterium]
MFAKWWNRLSILLIIAVAAGAIYAVWPNEPERYLPSAIPWPHGQGVPSSVASKLPCRSTQTKEQSPSANCRGMTLGLDLKGGSRVTLQAAPPAGLTAADIKESIRANKDIIDSRLNPFGVSESSVQVSGNDKLIVEAPGLSASQLRDLTRPAVLMWCEGLQQGGQGRAGSPIGTVPDGLKVYYQPGTCQPDVDSTGAVALKDPATGQIAKNADGTIQRVAPTYTSGPVANNIVWTPAKGKLNGAETIMTGSYLKRNTQISFDQLGQPILTFNLTSDGAKIFGDITRRIGGQNGLPLANFLDGEPIRDKSGTVIAPSVRSEITNTGQTTGLTLDAARKLKTFLNNGAFPIPMNVIQQQDVDATLGDQAVLHSVQAGLIAMLLIMAFMTLYYRLPGLLASLALVIYTAVVLAIFKIGIPGSGPVTLTLAGIAAFVLSVGMAVDANILIFERTKEELRSGRSLIPAVNAGFDRAWPSIRDSNSSTLITTAILYWMGNAFSSTLIKGFALTLAIGVVISLFSAITVTRGFLRLAIATPLARRLWLWTDDHPDIDERTAGALGPVGPTGVEGADGA